MGLNAFSKYESGGSTRSMNSSTSWGNLEPDTWQNVQGRAVERPPQKASSFVDLVMGRCTLENVMQEFRMNGSDSPYDPDELWASKHDSLAGMGPSSVYLRQKSWPAPERSPMAPLPRRSPCPREAPRMRLQGEPLLRPGAPQTATPAPFTRPEQTSTPMPEPTAALSAEQLAVLRSLPHGAVLALLRQLEQQRRSGKRHTDGSWQLECRFCKNNGEREAYYRSHALKEPGGRVACPVLRAFVCRRCGASGDAAHTVKYCPLTTNDERIKSAAMMRSVRMASGRRRSLPPSSGGTEYVVFGQTSPAVVQDTNAFGYIELDPVWAALEQKLML